MTHSIFADLSIKLAKEPEELVERASNLGFKVIGVEERAEYSHGSLEGLSKVTMVRRVTFEVDSNTDLDSLLRKVDSKTLVSVVPLDFHIYREAAKNERVDMIRFAPGTPVRPDKETLNLLLQRGGGAVEIPLRPLISNERLLSFLYEVLIRCYRVGLRSVVVSDAESPYELWHPLEIIGLLSSLGIPREYAISSLTSSPGFVLSRRGLRLEGVPAQGTGGKQ